MRLLPASPRKRRRLAWAAAVVLAVGALAAAIVGSRQDRAAPQAETRGIGWAAPTQPSTVKRTAAQLEAPLAVAARFIRTAVERRNVDASWDLVTPSLKAGYTRRRWAQGEIPIVPYPVDSARWAVDYSFEDSVGFQVALFPKPGSSVPATVFLLDLKSVPAGKGKQWLVSSFTPTPQEASTVSAPQTAQRARTSDRQVLGAAWLLVPLALLGLAILVPITLGISYWWRVKRAERNFARGRY